MLSVHHIALKTKNVEKLAEFYESLFSFHKIKDHFDEQGKLRSIWLKVESIILMIERQDESYIKVDSPSGLFLMSFKIEESEKESWRIRLAQNQVSVEEESNCTLYFRDLDGNRLALSHYPTPQI